MISKIFRLALTPGEPAGIGPDLILQIAQQAIPAELVVIADQHLLQQRAQQLGIPINLMPADLSQSPQQHRPGTLKIIHVPLKTASFPGRFRYLLLTRISWQRN